MKFRKITALLLVLCMLLSLSISVFAAEADEHTIYDSAPDEEPVVSSEAATSGTIQNFLQLPEALYADHVLR